MADEAYPIRAQAHEVLGQAQVPGQRLGAQVNGLTDRAGTEHTHQFPLDGERGLVGGAQLGGDIADDEHAGPVRGVAVDHAGVVDVDHLVAADALPAGAVRVVGRGQAAAAHRAVEVGGLGAAAAAGDVAEEEVLVEGAHLAAAAVAAPPHGRLEQAGQFDFRHGLNKHGRHLGEHLVEHRAGLLEQVGLVGGLDPALAADRLADILHRAGGEHLLVELPGLVGHHVQFDAEGVEAKAPLSEQLRNHLQAAHFQDLADGRFPAGAGKALADHEQRRAGARHEQMGRLGGAAQVEQVGVVDDQGAVQVQLVEGLLQGAHAGVDFVLGRVTHGGHGASSAAVVAGVGRPGTAAMARP